MLAWVSLALAILAPLFYYIHHTLALPPRPLPSAQSGFSSFFIVMCSSEHALTLIFCWVTQCWNGVTFFDTTRNGIYNEEFRISNTVRVWVAVD